MGWSGGTYTRAGAVHTGSTVWADSAGDGDATISSTEHDTHDQDLADGINACVAKDGSNAWTGDQDAGSSYHITNLAAGSASGDSVRWDDAAKKTGGLTLSGTTLSLEYNDGTSSDLDIASVGSAGEVTLTGAQTITGKKTFSANTILSGARFSGAHYSKLTVLTAAASVAVDITASNKYFLSNTRSMTLTWTVPTGSDTDLGANYSVDGRIKMRNGTGHGAITLTAPVGITDYEEIGSRPTAAGAVYELVWSYDVIGSDEYMTWTWVTS